MGKKTRRNRIGTGRLVGYLAIALLSLLLIAMISLRLYLATSLPAAQLSRYLSSTLKYRVTVSKIRLRDGAIVLEQVRVQNPVGFPARPLAAADAVTVAPQWGELLLSRQRFRLIGLQGISIDLQQNGKGEWNFSQLQRLLAARKSKKETYVKDFSIADGTVMLHGEGAHGISLHVYNLTSKGSANSTVDFTFQDPARNVYSVKGTARGGAAAALDLQLTAPKMSLQGLAASLKMKNAKLLQGSSGALTVNASFAGGELSCSGEFRFAAVRLPAAGKDYAAAGALVFAGDYNSSSDTARLTKLGLEVNKLASLRATGKMTGVRRERLFSLELTMDPTDLAPLNLLVPEERRKGVLVGGRLRCDRLQIEGSRGMGLETASGTLLLEDGSLTREGRLLLDGLSGSIGLFGQDSVLLATGRLSSAGGDNVLVSGADLPFSIEFSPRLQPVKAELPAFKATVWGVPLRGSIGYDRSRATPVSAKVAAAQVSLPTLNAQLRRFGFEARSGHADLVVDLAGRGADDLTAHSHLKFRDLRGIRGGKTYTAKSGTVSAELRKSGEQFRVQGNAELAGLALGSATATGRFGFDYAGNRLELRDLRGNVAGTDLSVARLGTNLPPRQGAAQTGRYPLSLDIAGCTVKRGAFELRDLSGRYRGELNLKQGTWLEGGAELAAQGLYRLGEKLAAPTARILFSRSGASATLTGKLLDGTLAGNAAFDPFLPGQGGRFDLAVEGARAAAAAPFMKKAAGYVPSAGSVNLRLKGHYSTRDGLVCSFDGTGRGIGVAGSGGKTLLSGAAFAVSGGIEKGNLSIGSGSFTPGPGVTLKLKGNLTAAFSAKPAGGFSFSLPQASLDDLVDPFANLLPRYLQEATYTGKIGAEGRLDLREGKKLLQGKLLFARDRVEIITQKLEVGEINGTLPFSLDLSGKTAAKPQEGLSFSRDNYQRVLQKLRQGNGGGNVVTVDRLDFGPLKFGKLTLHLGAENGLTRVMALDSTLAEGKILGTGYLRFGEKINYRTDLVVNELSLKALCGMFPNIKGYISGKVDGVVSVNGNGKGLAALTGFVNLWAHEGGGERMLVSKEFLQRLAKRKMTGFFFRSDRPYDHAEIKALLEEGDLSFDTLSIQHTNFFGVRDLSVSIAPAANRISLDHLLESIKEASGRGKATTGGEAEQPAETAPPAQEFKWGE